LTKQKTYPVPTPEQVKNTQIQAAILKSTTEQTQNGFAPSPPPNFPVKIGDRVRLGYQTGYRVEAKIDDGKYLLLSRSQPNLKPNPKSTLAVENYGVVPWYAVSVGTPDESGIQMRPRNHFQFRNLVLDGLLALIARDGINNTQDYQRGHVWAVADQVCLIDSIFQRRDIGKFLIIEHNEPNDIRYEILDGKQRLQALADFTYGLFQYKGLFHWELSAHDRHQLKSTVLDVGYLLNQNITRKEKLELFLSVNAAGIPQTQSQIAHVRTLLASET